MGTCDWSLHSYTKQEQFTIRHVSSCLVIKKLSLNILKSELMMIGSKQIRQSNILNVCEHIPHRLKTHFSGQNICQSIFQKKVVCDISVFWKMPSAALTYLMIVHKNMFTPISFIYFLLTFP